MVKYLFAMQREADMIDVPNKYVIGIRGTNMPKTTKEDIIVNLGYCGAYKIPVGTIVEPRMVSWITEGIPRILEHHFDVQRVRCITSDKFVTEPVVLEESIYDMELYKIAKLPHKELYSLKIVSDNLNEEDCENFNDQECWNKIKLLLKEKEL